MKLKEGMWGHMSVDDRESFLVSVILTLGFFTVLFVAVGMCMEKMLLPLIEQYPIFQVIYLMIYLVSGLMGILGVLLLIWDGEISHWDGFE